LARPINPRVLKAATGRWQTFAFAAAWSVVFFAVAASRREVLFALVFAVSALMNAAAARAGLRRSCTWCKRHLVSMSRWECEHCDDPAMDFCRCDACEGRDAVDAAMRRGELQAPFVDVDELARMVAGERPEEPRAPAEPYHASFSLSSGFTCCGVRIDDSVPCASVDVVAREESWGGENDCICVACVQAVGAALRRARDGASAS